MSRSVKLAKLITEYKEDEICCLSLSYIPGGPETFELAAKFCYGMKLDITPHNVDALQCIANYLEKTEEYGEGNLLTEAEGFLHQVVLQSWKDYVQALHSCDGFIQKVEELQIVRKCVDSLAMKACTDLSLIGWPKQEQEGLHSLGGSILWNGISTGARHRHPQSDWWHEDITFLSVPVFKLLISLMEKKGIRAENIARALVYYAKKSIQDSLEDRQEMQTRVYPWDLLLLNLCFSSTSQYTKQPRVLAWRICLFSTRPIFTNYRTRIGHGTCICQIWRSRIENFFA